MKTPLTLVLLSALAASGFSAPTILLSTNNMNSGDVPGASRLQADGTWFLGFNSPSMTLDLWRKVCASIGTSTFVTEDSGTSPGYLMNEQMTSRLILRNSTGNYVSVLGDGSPLAATGNPELKTDTQILRWSFAPANGTEAVKPLLSELPKSGNEVLLQAYAGKWVMAASGGGSTLNAVYKSPSYWERLRFTKLSAGDKTIRSNDPISIQTWTGFFNGGNYVSADLNDGAKLVANRGSVGPWETFSAVYPCEYVTGSQIAPVTHAMAYHENSDVAPGAKEYTLNPSNIKTIAERIGGNRVVVLAREFVDISHAPGPLPTLKQQVVDAVASPYCKGVVWEVSAGGDLGKGNILKGIEAVRSKGKDCFMMIAPRQASTNYTADLSMTIDQLKKSKYYDSLKIVLTCYRTDDTHVHFLGKENSVEGALKWLKAHR